MDVSAFTNDTVAFLSWLQETDPWMHGYVQGRVDAGESDYPQQLAERFVELQADASEHSAGFHLLVAHVSASPQDREAYDARRADIDARTAAR